MCSPATSSIHHLSGYQPNIIQPYCSDWISAILEYGTVHLNIMVIKTAHFRLTIH
ncbi:hypothetical protein GBAR_LOCUS23937 [Geodia barretti]|uniref:Uncharacterized protein n=1 Tax=Geodia barretti TaxID=519541 RepID=A0AA35T7E5_GEOBA|nr:hypothetical protein GBAR_LOCUS23937 [Geodia barretti]